MVTYIKRNCDINETIIIGTIPREIGMNLGIWR